MHYKNRMISEPNEPPNDFAELRNFILEKKVVMAKKTKNTKSRQTKKIDFMSGQKGYSVDDYNDTGPTSAFFKSGATSKSIHDA